MLRTLLALTLLLSATPALASELTTADILAIVGPRTCQDGGFTDVMPRQLSIPIVTLDPNVYYEYCFKLPRLKKSELGTKTSGLVQLQTANLGDGACGTASAYVIKPNRRSIFGKNDHSPRAVASVNSAQPGAVLTYGPGKWRVVFKYETGCNKYKLDVTW